MVFQFQNHLKIDLMRLNIYSIKIVFRKILEKTP